jgi:hypothetical protein
MGILEFFFQDLTGNFNRVPLSKAFGNMNTPI